MIFVTAMTIGIVAGLTRSMVSVALIAALIGFAYAAALLVSPGQVSILSLVLAIAGYNSALLGHVVVLLALNPPQEA
jgi:hypothetical protein